jgi:hypothetical protein
MGLTRTSIAPYIVNHFIWEPKTGETIVGVTVSKCYTQSDTDETVELELGKFNRDPNSNYFIPKNCFSVHSSGSLFVDDEKRTGQQTCRPEPAQWEFDRQAYLDDLHNFITMEKSLNTTVWRKVDQFISETYHDNNR